MVPCTNQGWLFPAAIILAIQIVEIDIDAGGEIVFDEIDRCFGLDPYFIPARTGGGVLRFVARPTHGAATGDCQNARQKQNQG